MENFELRNANFEFRVSDLPAVISDFGIRISDLFSRLQFTIRNPQFAIASLFQYRFHNVIAILIFMIKHDDFADQPEGCRLEANGHEEDT